MTLDMGVAILLLRLGLVLLLYLFLVQVLLVTWRDLRSTQATPAVTAPENPAARLVVLDGSASGLAAGTEFILDVTNTLGRVPPNTIIIPDPAISARHARLAYHQGRWWLEDLGSANGTYLNGVPVEKPTPVADGDEIELAQVKLRLEML